MPTLNDSIVSAACMEHQIFDHIKQALLVTLNWQAPVIGIPRKLSSLQFTIKSFQRHLDRIISIEEEGGYMVDAMDSKPYLQDRVEQLQTEHSRFRERLRKMIPELNDTKEWDEARFNRICADLRSFVEDLDRHNEREIEVIQESICVEEGGEG